MASRLKIARCFFGAVLLAGCSIAPPGTDIHDPNEAHNREIHAFNKAFNQQISGSGNGANLPPEVTAPVVNFADNVRLPGMVVNGLLQADIEGAVTNTMRFLVNTTIGIAGLFDPADAIGIAEQETDFGETLAVWGAPEGAYIELPLLGPTTERELAGKVVDIFLDPIGAVGTDVQLTYGTGAKLAERVIRRSQLSGAIDDVYSSADSYSQQRLVFYQNRRFELGTTDNYVGAEVDPYADLYGE